jgi:hypothetical protein
VRRAPPGCGRRCWSCGRFVRWRRFSYRWISPCCLVEAFDPGVVGRVVVEVVRELEIAGERFVVAVSTSRNPGAAE